MVHVLSPVRSGAYSVHATPHASRPVRPRTTSVATDSSATTNSATVPNFQSLLSPASSSDTTAASVTGTGGTPAAVTFPTAESVFGPSPWMSNPTGTAPNGQTYGYNPYYFATAQTAATVAQIVGGTVVQTNAMVSSGGFSQQQPNYMVQLADGRLVNPGLVASFYTHGYPQSYIDLMVANEVKNA